MAEKTINQEEPKGFNAHLATGGFKFWLSAILISFLVPPAGLLLAIYLIIKRSWSALDNSSLLMSILLIVAALAGAVGYFKIYQALYNNGLNHNYTQLEVYSMPGIKSQDHSGVTFLKPKEFIKASDTRTVKISSSFLVHYQDATHKESLAIISATSSTEAPGASNSKNIDYINSTLEKPKSKDYAGFLMVLKQYMVGTGAKGFDVDITNSSPLKTKNIDKNAWQFDYVTKNKSNTTGYKQGQVVRRGKIVFCFGKQVYYYFRIDTNERNWQANTKVWPQILDSLKIDQ